MTDEIDTVTATKMPEEVTTDFPPAFVTGFWDVPQKGKTRWANRALKFYREITGQAAGRYFYAYAQGTRKPVSLGLGFSLGPKNSVAVLTLPLIELCAGFSELEEYERR